ncbi:MAG: hypothetical protein F7C34_01790 [Desulfurococcales archaeon]|nr:hypothetical protein [Desulfurococcales archaeon]
MRRRESYASRARPLAAFILLSLVSLLSDTAYEGARGVLGPYTRILQASMLVAGGLMIGELVGQLVRAATGGIVYKLHTPRALWGLTLAGYIVNLVAVPLLALVGRWEEALALVIVERAGKGLRAPARDVILAEIAEKTRGLGAHRAFALHELADQVGAVLGPLMIAVAASHAGVRTGLALTAIPAGLALAALALAIYYYPSPGAPARSGQSGKAPRRLLLAAAGIGLSLAPLPAWPVATYNLEPARAAGLYSAAMAADALAALAVGELARRKGLASISSIPVLGLATGLLLAVALSKGGNWIILFAVSWGITMGAYEVLSRSSVAVMLRGPGARGLAYGVLGLSTAIAMLASGLGYASVIPALGPLGAILTAIILATPGPALLIASLARGDPRKAGASPNRPR